MKTTNTKISKSSVSSTLLVKCPSNTTKQSNLTNSSVTTLCSFSSTTSTPSSLISSPSFTLRSNNTAQQHHKQNQKSKIRIEREKNKEHTYNTLVQKKILNSNESVADLYKNYSSLKNVQQQQNSSSNLSHSVKSNFQTFNIYTSNKIQIPIAAKPQDNFSPNSSRIITNTNNNDKIPISKKSASNTATKKQIKQQNQNQIQLSNVLNQHQQQQTRTIFINGSLNFNSLLATVDANNNQQTHHSITPTSSSLISSDLMQQQQQEQNTSLINSSQVINVQNSQSTNEVNLNISTNSNHQNAQFQHQQFYQFLPINSNSLNSNGLAQSDQLNQNLSTHSHQHFKNLAPGTQLIFTQPSLTFPLSSIATSDSSTNASINNCNNQKLLSNLHASVSKATNSSINISQQSNKNGKPINMNHQTLMQNEAASLANQLNSTDSGSSSTTAKKMGQIFDNSSITNLAPTITVIATTSSEGQIIFQTVPTSLFSTINSNNLLNQSCSNAMMPSITISNSASLIQNTPNSNTNSNNQVDMQQQILQQNLMNYYSSAKTLTQQNSATIQQQQTQIIQNSFHHQNSLNQIQQQHQNETLNQQIFLNQIPISNSIFTTNSNLNNKTSLISTSKNSSSPINNALKSSSSSSMTSTNNSRCEHESVLNSNNITKIEVMESSDCKKQTCLNKSIRNDKHSPVRRSSSTNSLKVILSSPESKNNQTVSSKNHNSDINNENRNSSNQLDSNVNELKSKNSHVFAMTKANSRLSIHSTLLSASILSKKTKKFNSIHKRRGRPCLYASQLGRNLNESRLKINENKNNRFTANNNSNNNLKPILSNNHQENLNPNSNVNPGMTTSNGIKIFPSPPSSSTSSSICSFSPKIDTQNSSNNNNANNFSVSPTLINNEQRKLDNKITKSKLMDKKAKKSKDSKQIEENSNKASNTEKLKKNSIEIDHQKIQSEQNESKQEMNPNEKDKCIFNSTSFCTLKAENETLTDKEKQFTSIKTQNKLKFGSKVQKSTLKDSNNNNKFLSKSKLVLTHVIEGFILKESSEPFSVFDSNFPIDSSPDSSKKSSLSILNEYQSIQVERNEQNSYRQLYDKKYKSSSLSSEKEPFKTSENNNLNISNITLNNELSSLNINDSQTKNSLSNRRKSYKTPTNTFESIEKTFINNNQNDLVMMNRNLRQLNKKLKKNSSLNAKINYKLEKEKKSSKKTKTRHHYHRHRRYNHCSSSSSSSFSLSSSSSNSSTSCFQKNIKMPSSNMYNINLNYDSNNSKSFVNLTQELHSNKKNSPKSSLQSDDSNQLNVFAMPTIPPSTTTNQSNLNIQSEISNQINSNSPKLSDLFRSNSLINSCSFEMRSNTQAFPLNGACINIESCKNFEQLPNGNPTEWNCDEVFEFIKFVAGVQVAELFKSQEVDGSALTLIRDDHLVNTMKIKLGPALKIMNKFNELRFKFNSLSIKQNKTLRLIYNEDH